jgi:methionine sulfoxide reductase catalytic subunit
MIHIRKPPGWKRHDDRPTPEDVFINRRHFLKVLGLGAIGGATGLLAACSGGNEPVVEAHPSALTPLPAKRNSRYALDRPLTDEATAARYNNYYEFTDQKDVYRYVSKFQPEPWTVEVTGLVHKPQTFDVAALLKSMPLEERLYRHRCVEAWAMAVPWIGFPLKALLDRVEPMSAARYVRFISFKRPSEAPGQRMSLWYPWPYFEGLRLDEALNELTLLATGIYGHELPTQHGAPLRLVVPWKYGYKSAKGIVRIELVEKQPATFWNQLAPDEYSFESNVNPAVPHPRWSQARERLIDTGEYRPTQPYNGYGEFVAKLYA